MSDSDSRRTITITGGTFTGSNIAAGGIAEVVCTAAAVMNSASLTGSDLRLIVALLGGRATTDLLGRVGLVVPANSLVLQWLGYQQDRTEYARPDPPNVTVVVQRPDPAEIERIVDERLREREQQRQAEHADDDARRQDRRGADR